MRGGKGGVLEDLPGLGAAAPALGVTFVLAAPPAFGVVLGGIPPVAPLACGGAIATGDLPLALALPILFLDFTTRNASVASLSGYPP